MAEGLLSLCWNNYKSAFCNTLSNLREKERFSDATLACEGKFYPVHKLVLSFCSEYFDDILNSTPCKHPVIVLKDIKTQDIESLLCYMYTGVVSVPQNDIPRLINAAEMLHIKGLAVPDDMDTDPIKVPNGSSKKIITSPPNKRRKKENIFNSDPGTYTSENVEHNKVNKKTESNSESQLRITAREIKEESSLCINSIQVVDDKEPEINEMKQSINYNMVVNNNESSNQSHQNHNFKSEGQPLAEAVAEALAGPSTVQTWLASSDMASTFTTVDYNPETTTSQTSHTQNPQLGTETSSSEASASITVEQNMIGVRPDLYTSVSSNRTCPYCFRSTFRQTSDLKRHIRTHTGEKPFKCDQCSYRASRKDLLLSHNNKIHKGQSLL